MESQRQHVKKTLGRLLERCKNIRELKQIHAHIITSPHLSFPHDHTFLISRVLFFCALSHSNSLSYADQVFKLFPRPNLFMYNAMIRAYASNIRELASCRAFILYKQMLVDNISPDCITLPFVLKECSLRSDGFTGRTIHAHVLKFGFDSDVYAQNSLINLYSECGALENAKKMFDEMPNRDIVSWNSIIIGCLRCGELDMALYLSRMMKKKNIITWNSMITGFVQGGRPKEALEVFHEMQVASDDDLVKPDKITVASVLSACAALGAIDHGRWVHMYLERSGLDCDMVIGTALVDMYGKCGHVSRAVEVFQQMPKKDVLAWTAMISVFALHGHATEAFELFAEMKAARVRPNAVTFVGLLTACSHSGLVEKGRLYFDIMKDVYSIQPQVQHYACMVDILGRAGLFEEAEEIIRSMPMEPDVFVWGALLGGCQMHGNFKLGEKIAWNLIGLEPQNHAFYINLCDIYSKANKLDHVKRIRTIMNDEGIKKAIPGCSMIEVNGNVLEFSVRGSPEVPSDQIKLISTALTDAMKMDSDTAIFFG